MSETQPVIKWSYSFQDNESLNSHPGGVGEGSQGLSEAKPLETDSRLSRVLKGCEIVNDKGTNEDLSHPFRMQSTLGTVPGVSLPLNPWLPSSRPSRARIKKTFSLKLYLTRGRIGRASPAVGEDGSVYVGDNENYFYAISSEGQLIWRHRVSGRLGDRTSSITDDGTVLITTETGRLYAVNLSGEIQWASNWDWLALTSPVTTSNGLAIVGAKKQALTNGQYERLIAVDQWGNTIWEVSTQGEVGGAPASGADGTIYFGTQRGYFYAVTPNGDVKWHLRLGGRITSSPALTVDGLALIGTQDGYLFAVSPNWEMVWNYYAGEMIRHSSPAMAADGTIYFGCCDHCLYALTSDGRLKWKFRTDHPVSSSPAVAANGTIYFSSQDKHFYALHPDGRLKWTLQTDSPLTTSPTITEEGDVIICNQNRCVMSLDEQNGGPALSGWSQLQGNPRRNGRVHSREICSSRTEHKDSRVPSSQSEREAQTAPSLGVAHQNR